MRQKEMNEAIFINTPLPRGVGTTNGRQNPFNGFLRQTETVETVSIHPSAENTLPKQGVNETWRPNI